MVEAIRCLGLPGSTLMPPNALKFMPAGVMLVQAPPTVLYSQIWPLFIGSLSPRLCGPAPLA